MKKPLSPKPRRKDFTDREICSLIGGLLGSLTGMADLDQIRNAVVWWAETEQAWKELETAKAIEEQLSLAASPVGVPAAAGESPDA